MKQISRVIVLVFTLGIFMSGVTAQETSSSGEASHRLAVGVGVHERIYDDPEVSLTTFRPFARYQYQVPEYRFSFNTGGVVNRLDAAVNFSKNFSVLAGGFGNFIFFGDSVRIDGVDRGEYEFDGHRFGPYAGLVIRNPQEGFPVQLRMLYEFEFAKFYGGPSAARNPTFVMPKNFKEHGLVARVEVGGDSSGELRDLAAIRTNVYGTYKWRIGNEAWGDPNFGRDVDRYLGFSAALAARWEFVPRWVAVLNVQGSSLSKADRLNALRDATLAQEHLGLTMGDIKSERGASGDIGVRYYLSENRTIAVRPFAHMVSFREITPEGFRRDTGAGLGFKLAGLIWQSFDWEVSYANLFGVRDDIHAIHDARALVRYQFSW